MKFQSSIRRESIKWIYTQLNRSEKFQDFTTTFLLMMSEELFFVIISTEFENGCCVKSETSFHILNCKKNLSTFIKGENS